MRAFQRCAAGLGLALGLVGGAAPCALQADDARPAWAAELEALRLEKDGVRRMERTWALLEKKPDAAALARELERPLPWAADARRGMTQWTRDVPGAGPLTVFAYVPAAYTPAKAWPVLVWMHGGVARDEDGGGLSGLGMLRDAAEGGGFLLLSPSATKACTWWSEPGAVHLRGALRELATTYHVDPTRIAAGGFSDGGSGCYHLLAHDPDPYGCFLALMGNPLVTRLAGGPTFPGNCASRPVLAFNGGTDQLYPSAQMKPVVEELKQAGAALTWEDLPTAGHDPTEAMARWGSVAAFWASNPRRALPVSVDWETATPSIDGRRAWVEILEVHAAALGAEGLASKPLPLPPTAQRPRLGIGLDNTHDGLGVAIEKVEPGAPAAEAGFQPGDVIVKVGESVLPAGQEAFQALRTYLDGLQGAEGVFGVRRGEESLSLRTRPRVLKQDEPPAALGYGRPSGRVRAEVKDGNLIDISTRGVKSLRLHLSRALLDTSREVVVTLNGKEAFRGVPKPDADYLLSEALRGLPGDPLFESSLVLRP